jgi:hypothetical protein
VGANDSNVVLEDVRIVFRNFEGREGQYNREGDRNFAVVLDDDLAQHMLKDGWNVKTKPEEGDDNFNYLSVAVSFKGRPPTAVLITSRGRTNLDKETIDVLDWIDIKTVDMIIRPYQWAVSGKTGIKAYLHAIYVTMEEDVLQLKYADVKQIGTVKETPALERGFIDVEFEEED